MNFHESTGIGFGWEADPSSGAVPYMTSWSGSEKNGLKTTLVTHDREKDSDSKMLVDDKAHVERRGSHAQPGTHPLRPSVRPSLPPCRCFLVGLQRG